MKGLIRIIWFICYNFSKRFFQVRLFSSWSDPAHLNKGHPRIVFLKFKVFSESQIFKFDLREKERSPFDYKKRGHSQLTYDGKKIKRVLFRKIKRFLIGPELISCRYVLEVYKSAVELEEISCFS